jgi:SAM-dependent methyltransferase
MKNSIFDIIVNDYHEMRPRYPNAIFNSIIHRAGINLDAKILEIGPGTGQATDFFAKQGYKITAIELGREMASFIENEFVDFSNLQVINCAFEEVSLPINSYDLIFAATSFHWIRPECKFTKPYTLLKPNGCLAIIETKHLLDDNNKAFFIESQFIYKKYRGDSSDPSTLNDISEVTAIKVDENLFRRIHFQVFPLKLKYSASEYVRLLSTYSDVILMEESKRNDFLNDIKNLIIDRFNNIVWKYYGLSLTIVQKKQ